MTQLNNFNILTKYLCIIRDLQRAQAVIITVLFRLIIGLIEAYVLFSFYRTSVVIYVVKFLLSWFNVYMRTCTIYVFLTDINKKKL